MQDRRASQQRVVDVSQGLDRLDVDGPPRPFFDHVFKITSSGPLYLRIWASQEIDRSCQLHPWAFRIHGGGFLHGEHTNPTKWHTQGFLTRGIHVVSIAYRFPPHISIYDQLQDCLDAYSWCHARLSDVLIEQGYAIDISRCIAVGGSAGATLALLVGHLARPRVLCVMDCFGITDFTKRLPFPDAEAEVDGGLLTESDIKNAMRSNDDSKAVSWCPYLTPSISFTEIEDVNAVQRTDLRITTQVRAQFEIFMYIFFRHLTYPIMFRRDEMDEASYQHALSALSPVNIIDKTFPPTIIMHGEADNLVDIGHSRDLANRLRELNVPVMETYVKNGGHGLDEAWTDANHSGWKDYVNPILDDISRFLFGTLSSSNEVVTE